MKQKNETGLSNDLYSCDSTPIWIKVPTPSYFPLEKMEWATGTKKDKFGCTRINSDGTKKFHAGIDLKAKVGTLCFAMEDSTVESVGFGQELGKWVTLSYKKGGKIIGVAYCHLSETSVVEGTKIIAGTKIGKTGVSGNAEPTNPHLHLEFQDQIFVAYSDVSNRIKHGLDPNEMV
ncbi:MAG: hypothetical protein RL308_68 [Bacteroidota bacterium]|jgi:murein DD-endopeptidase MepM/ murein hydrolase activator NlpD